MHSALALALLSALALGCTEPRWSEPERLGGRLVAPDVLELGENIYQRYCVLCHGEEGNGRGAAAENLWPPPRDFRSASFKFAGVEDRGLPADAELARIISDGLAGTAMKGWDLPAAELDAVIQYLKTFSPPEKGFRDERLEVSAPVYPPDPYAKDASGAISRGERLYHSVFQCASCHPAYVPLESFAAWGSAARTDDPYAPVPKWAAPYGAVVLPPDFFRHPLRAVRAERGPGGELDHSVADLYRTIAYGLRGPMPGYGHLGAADVWAVAHYVKSLADKRAETASASDAAR